MAVAVNSVFFGHKFRFTSEIRGTNKKPITMEDNSNCLLGAVRIAASQKTSNILPLVDNSITYGFLSDFTKQNIASFLFY